MKQCPIAAGTYHFNNFYPNLTGLPPVMETGIVLETDRVERK